MKDISTFLAFAVGGVIISNFKYTYIVNEENGSS